MDRKNRDLHDLNVTVVPIATCLVVQHPVAGPGFSDNACSNLLLLPIAPAAPTAGVSRSA